MSARVLAEARASFAEARAFLVRALDRPQSDRLRAVAVPAPVAPPETLLDLESDAWLFDAAPDAIRFQGTRLAALGACAELEAHGPERFEELGRGARALFARLDLARHSSVDPSFSPRLVGGFAFAEAGEPWDGFPAARFVLPRWMYLLGALIYAGDDPRAAALELEAIWSRLERRSPASRPTAQAIGMETRPGLAEWTVNVEAALTAIARGTIEKLVLARTSRVTFDAPLDDRAVIARLAAAGGLRYLVRRRGNTFLGATPERLVKKAGARIEADALAGTAAPEALAQLYTDKSTREHAMVVRFIRERLSSIAELDGAARTSIERASSIRHLYTPVRAQARGRTSLFTLAGALHPTPAVCGRPVAAARAQIEESEPFARGWYSGAVGWLDGAGGGELYVALRCAYLAGSRADLYAGAGIVEGSCARDEYLETALKERVMLRALGAET